MSDEEITRVANDLSRHLRFILKFLAAGWLASPTVLGFQVGRLESRFKTARKSLRTLESLGLAQSWSGNKGRREPEGELWAITMDGMGVHYECVNRGLYEIRKKEIRPYPSVV